MIDNINKLSSNLDGTKQQLTAASLVNLTDDGKILSLTTLIRKKQK